MIVQNQMECQKKCLDISIAKKYGYRPVNNFDRGFETTLKFYESITN